MTAGNEKDPFNITPGPLETGHTPSEKIAILGTGLTRELAPYDDEAWDIWSSGPVTMDTKRWTDWIEVHDPKTWALNDDEQMLQYYSDLKEGMKDGKRVHVLTPDERWEGAFLLPAEHLIETFRSRWLTSSVAWMMALALSRPKTTHIGLWGIGMEDKEEYREQREAIIHFIDLARDRGIKVHVPGGCPLLASPLPYPLNKAWQPYLTVNSRRHTMTQMRDGIEQQEAALRDSRLRMEGTIEALEWVERNALS